MYSTLPRPLSGALDADSARFVSRRTASVLPAPISGAQGGGAGLEQPGTCSWMGLWLLASML